MLIWFKTSANPYSLIFVLPSKALVKRISYNYNGRVSSTDWIETLSCKVYIHVGYVILFTILL